ncbi:MAG TPA: alkaline phosphatase family protein [Candidatus Eremiobacteraceae bacterium]
MQVPAMLVAALLLAAAGGGARAAEPVHAHASTVIVIVMENRDSVGVIGDTDAPFINDTLVPQAALMTDSHAVAHPSEPNYLALFSGSPQGVADDSCPHSFGATNLGAEVIAAGKTFAGYSESMPSDGFTGCRTSLYARKHNPWVNFTNVPASSNLIWHGLPNTLPAVSFIVPNMCDDMHDCSTKTGDDWLKANLPAILKYDAAHDGLAILTWDEAEPDTSGKNAIPTLLLGPTIFPGKYDQKIDHYAVLHTIEDIAGVACTASACGAPVLTGMWR